MIRPRRTKPFQIDRGLPGVKDGHRFVLVGSWRVVIDADDLQGGPRSDRPTNIARPQCRSRRPGRFLGLEERLVIRLPSLTTRLWPLRTISRFTYIPLTTALARTRSN